MTPENIAREQRINAMTKILINANSDRVCNGYDEISEAFGRAAKWMAIAVSQIGSVDEATAIKQVEGLVARGFTAPVEVILTD